MTYVRLTVQYYSFRCSFSIDSKIFMEQMVTHYGLVTNLHKNHYISEINIEPFEKNGIFHVILTHNLRYQQITSFNVANENLIQQKALI